MTRNVITIGPDMPVAEAADLMSRRRVRRLLVVALQHDDPHLLGIVSATDILHAYPPDVNPFAVVVREIPEGSVAIREIMKLHPLTVTPDLPIEEGALIMRDQKIGALPVVSNGKLVGIITESDIFRAFVSIFSSPQATVRVTLAISKGEDAFGLIVDVARRHAVRVLSFFTLIREDTPVCVVRLAGQGVEAMLETIWKSGHRVLNVQRHA